MDKIAPCLWFDGQAEEAAQLYTSVIPGSSITKVQKNLADGPAGPAGMVLLVEFRLAGQRFLALNGGMKMEYTHALSLTVNVDDQAELDRVWDGLMAGGGHPEQCGWLKDRYGVSWQVVPTAIGRWMEDPARGARVMQALLGMVKLDIATLEAAWQG
ncbi:VOC family protein [Roseococcus sp. YIM B11640]|uniref:VOC family protein n=1 Tax=Roseococcus sp. YIM B11640 TaxID=3133973 RepID=UPI003C7C6D58